MRQYNNLLSKYMNDLDIDLTRNLTPPKELDVQVRVLEDAGELDTETGEVISLTRGSEHLLRRADAEQLIRQGVLKHVD
ncbi:hypothetical protein PTSG_05328 [Salpingoeca rosetta]|uniref:DNA replication complex GINS protein PSF1 C-terminal domain-containing protein n=1 Tax=Salpingoeca rosetta (strain ATCC 50818 / BSB-021) TaxID=946362 RepID=F2UA45_SALR5|nr:uncharacterized protein PTSG_05328 [Salpingoeca rosetta]EGD73620.1 hypothetical protein PTSG_05328 [Salpingoeca rosetta]|eukprot:XP_004993901.1 hypothetical protein PTSG_05328 [Salpingoeca rosetta]